MMKRKFLEEQRRRAELEMRLRELEALHRKMKDQLAAAGGEARGRSLREAHVRLGADGRLAGAHSRPRGPAGGYSTTGAASTKGRDYGRGLPGHRPRAGDAYYARRTPI